MMLDVGCGCLPQGDVNCDLYVEDVGHRWFDQKVIPVKRSWNFVLCSCEALPFADNSFDLVQCWHVVEHMKNPLLLLCELLRVSCGVVKVRCPHKLGERGWFVRKFNPMHRWHFNLSWFKRFADWYGCRVLCTISAWAFFPTKYLRVFSLPCEVEVVFDKRWM